MDKEGIIMKDTLNEVYKFTKRVKSGEILTEEENKRFLELTDKSMDFVKSIENDYAATCITERYINGKSWHNIADQMGQLTDDSVRKCCERTIQRYS